MEGWEGENRFMLQNPAMVKMENSYSRMTHSNTASAIMSLVIAIKSLNEAQLHIHLFMYLDIMVVR